MVNRENVCIPREVYVQRNDRNKKNYSTKSGETAKLFSDLHVSVLLAYDAAFFVTQKKKQK